MKNTRTMRRIGWSVILTVAIVFSSVSTFAAWTTNNGGSYNGGAYQSQQQGVPYVPSGTYLNEIWLGSKQCINYYSNGQWVRNVAGEGHTLYVNGQIVMNDLFDTMYWCFDVNGNVFAIDTGKRLKLIKAGSLEVQTEDSLYSCTGFQRIIEDQSLQNLRNQSTYHEQGEVHIKFGYLVYMDVYPNSVSLNDLLNGYGYTNNNYNYNNYNYNNSYYGDSVLTQNGNEYSVTYNGNTYRYELVGSSFYYNGQIIDRNTQEIAFSQGYVLFVVKNGSTLAQVYRMPVGSTAKQLMGTGFQYFIYDNNGFVTYVKIGNNEVPVNSSSTYTYNDSYNYRNYDYDDYYGYYDGYYDGYYSESKVTKSGSLYMYYQTSSKYHKYQLSGSTLYYKGTNSTSKSVSLATSVDEITFTDGYVVYATTSGTVYAIKIGQTSSNSKVQIGTKFSYFDEEDDYWSYGYYNTSRNLIEFDEKLDLDTRNSRYGYDDYDFYVEKTGSTYYYYTGSNSNKYHKYQLSGSTLYYKGTNSTSKSVSLATSVDEITFTEDYVVYALSSGKVYKVEIGETTGKEYIGDKFDYFDEEDDYISNGYYNTNGKYVDF